ncbi:DUF4430 domain-containing protein [Enterococcus rivorum]|uniref:Transcobalamin-like C-terminal domain-containing protein n=1 Tax=Enterococcus rivorum TaxID=762845 RepID=A0A1E5KUE8_9ENTE|nr:DUF4430 domain-containing protein [Enterococcus rivorum]MBP2100625.1 basic membrane lipoprotein Med (substrate-binding protein (PBP1-ABC) superfamily) [Enterococcus rivorum]OEH81378.1 hypothetical protein BCR26_16660 [Enterococcus rivorum]
MKKLIKASIVVAAIFLLTGCGKSNEKQTTEKKEEKISVTVILKEDDKEFDKKELKVKKDESVQNIMEANYKVDMDKEFISGIDGHKQDAGKSKYWLYEVNGKQPDVGATEYFVKDGDKIIWTLNEL